MKLYELRGETSVFIDAEIDGNGNLVVSGQDVGKAPLEHWGDSDYEYWALIPKDRKDDLLLALLEKVFGGDAQAVSHIVDFARSRDIQCDFDTWI